MSRRQPTHPPLSSLSSKSFRRKACSPKKAKPAEKYQTRSEGSVRKISWRSLQRLAESSVNSELCSLQQRTFALNVYLRSGELKSVFAWLWLWWRWSGKSGSDLAISGFAAFLVSESLVSGECLGLEKVFEVVFWSDSGFQVSKPYTACEACMVFEEFCRKPRDL